MAYQPKQEKISKLGIAISVALHAVGIAVLVLVAAHEGMFGKHATRIVVTMLPKSHPMEKPIELPVEKPVEKPAEKLAQPLPVEHEAMTTLRPATAAPAPSARPEEQPMVSSLKVAAAPAVAAPPIFLFGGGASVESSSDPGTVYKGFLEYTLRSNWRRPDNLTDLNYAAEVEVGVDAAGHITGYEWERGSGNETWDDSVRTALARTKVLDRPPPKGFPDRVLVKFDVQQVRDALKP
jgi:hypothetical protein